VVGGEKKWARFVKKGFNHGWTRINTDFEQKATKVTKNKRDFRHETSEKTPPPRGVFDWAGLAWIALD
jgi:hypothetical protein